MKKGKPIKSKKGETFKKWKEQLEVLGYVVEHRELRACDYGAPTIRKRFFLIARCDGEKIIWPQPTHGDPNSLEVKAGLLKPWRTAADIIDWSIPCKSIFERNKPLAENTLKRIAKGLEKFVFNNPEPFIVSIGQTGFTKDRSRSTHDPLNTIVTKAEACLVTPYLAVNTTGHSGGDIKEPVHTITTGGHHALIAPTLIQYHTETTKNGVRGQRADEPIMTLDSSPRYALIAPFISRQFKSSIGHEMMQPLGTVTTIDKSNLVTAFLVKYYGGVDGQSIEEPLHTITTKDRFGLVKVKGEDYKIVDIGMRMLEPHELIAAQGFPENYIIDHDFTGKTYHKTKQVARCGNAVPPPFAKALVQANLPELCGEGGRFKEVG